MDNNNNLKKSGEAGDSNSGNKKDSQLTEVLTALILGIATLLSAWSAYQSALWDGEQTFHIKESLEAGRVASELAVNAYQIKSFDAQLFVSYISAVADENTKLADFLLERFPERLKTPTKIWLDSKPIQNKESFKTPFEMNEYVIEAESLSKKKIEESKDIMERANIDNTNSDKYVLLTVLFASVLFFGGMGSTVRMKTVKLIFTVTGYVIFIGTLIALITMPVTGL